MSGLLAERFDTYERNKIALNPFLWPWSTTTPSRGVDENRSRIQCRYFARKIGLNDEYDDDSFDVGRNRKDGQRPNLMSFDSGDDYYGNDFFDSSDDDEDDEEDDDDDYLSPEMDAVRAREEAVLERKKVFENKKGRGWSDDLEELEEALMANQKIEDLPQWTPECVSRTSRERVNVYPEKIPTLTALARLPLPMRTHPNPGEGFTKEYTLYRRDAIFKHVKKCVRAKAEARVMSIQSLRTWDEKQEAVDKLFEEVEFELKKDEVILGRQPQFGEWVEKALEEYLIEVDESNKEQLYREVAETVKTTADQQFKLIETRPKLEDKEAAFRALIASIDDIRSTVSNSQLEQHPLFSQWVAKGFEEYLSNHKKEAEDALFDQVSSSVRAKIPSTELDDIRRINSSAGRSVAINELSESIRDQMAKETFEGGKYNLMKWVKKLHEDSLYQQVAAAVQTEASSLPLDAVKDQDARDRLIHLRAKLLRHKFEQEDFPLCKHENFLSWLKRALEEHIDGSDSDLFQQVAVAVVPKVDGPRRESIHGLQSVADKWVAFDELCCSVVDELYAENFELSEHYLFDKWVKRALKEHLISLNVLPESMDGVLERKVSAPLSMIKKSIQQQISVIDESDETYQYPAPTDDEKAVPVFMDCYGPGCSTEQNVPDILRPLRFYDRSPETGRMMEDWLMSCYKETKRIMLRESTRTIAQLVKKGETTPQRVFVHGRQGVGKTAALMSIVASARSSGHIVHYMPDSRQLHECGKTVTVNKKREGMFDLPELSKSQCKILLQTHQTDLESFAVSRATMDKYFSDKRMETFGDSESVVSLLKLGEETEAAAPACYSCVMDVLMQQEEKPFTIIVDEFNIFFGKGKYYNDAYTINEKKRFIPHLQLSLFETLLKAAGLTIENDGEMILEPVLMKKGSIVVATSESHAVPRLVSDALFENAQRAEKTGSLSIVDVPRLSKLEAEHMLSSYEATGMGKLRLDEGATVTNPQEVEYLRMVSSSVAQNLFNACIDFD